MTSISTSRSTPTSPAPFSKGQWVAEGKDFQHPDIGHIKEVYWDDCAHEWVMDLVLYSPDGDRIGRKSPRMGGPAGFEPCVPCASWRRIMRPDFPLPRDRTGYRDWASALDYVEPGTSPA